MNDTDDAEGIFLNYCGRERTPDGKTQYASFEARIHMNTFAGTTHFEAAGEHLAWFASELSAFYTEFAGQPELRCGVGEDTWFRLKFSRYNPQGHVLVECDVRSPFRGDLFNTVRSCTIIELYQVHLISRFFEAILASNEPDSLRISAHY